MVSGRVDGLGEKTGDASIGVGVKSLAPEGRQGAATRDAFLRALIRRELPRDVFRNRPARLLLVIPLVTAISLGSAAVVWPRLPWLGTLAISLVVGHCYGSLMLFGHEVGHGAVVRSRRIQNTLLWITGLIFCVPPHLWRAWHHVTHHRHTNVPGLDPDNFGTLASYCDTPSSRLLVRFSPGSGHWLSSIYLPTFFTAHAQGILWWKSRIWDLPSYSRRRAGVESAAMAVFWAAAAWAAGPRGALFAVLIPMLVANTVIMSYIVTNHMMRPLSGPFDVLATTMSVTTARWLDRFHFHFSHHVEHHLFPGMPSCYYPLVRQVLRRHVPDHYLAPGHLTALRMVYATPRLYDNDMLADPLNSRKARFVDVEASLRGGPARPISLPPGGER